MRWQKLVTDFQVVDEDNKHEIAMAFLDYGSSLAAIADKEINIEEGALEKQTLQLLRSFGKQLCVQASCYGIKLVLAKPEAKWELPKILLPEWVPIAMLSTSMDKLQQKMKALDATPNDITVLATQWDMFETCAGVIASGALKDDALVHIKDPCQTFQEKFNTMLMEALTKVHNSSVKEMVEFVSKFSEVTQAASEWRMETFNWVFQGDDTKKCFERLNSAITAAKSYLKESRPILSHKSSHGIVKNAVKEVIELVSLVKAKLHEACSVAGILMVSGLFLSKDDASMDVNTLMDHCFTMYGLTVEKLPGKLQKMTIKAIDQAKVEKEKDKDKNDKKRKKDKKEEKESKKEKKMKS